MLENTQKQKKMFLNNFVPQIPINSSSDTIQTNAHLLQSNFGRVRGNSSSSISIDMAHIQQLKEGTNQRVQSNNSALQIMEDSQLNILKLSHVTSQEESKENQSLSAGVPETVRQTSNSNFNMNIDENNVEISSSQSSSKLNTILSLDEIPSVLQNTLESVIKNKTQNTQNEHEHCITQQSVQSKQSSHVKQVLTADQILGELGIKVKDKQMQDRFNKNFANSVKQFKLKRKTNAGLDQNLIKKSKKIRISESSKNSDDPSPKLKRQQSMANFIFDQSIQKNQLRQTSETFTRRVSMHTHQKIVFKQQNAIADGFMNNFDEIKQKNSQRFGSYTSNFLDLTKKSFIDTMCDVISVTISFDSKLALAVMQEKESNYSIKWYLLNSVDFEDPLGEIQIDGNICRTKEIEQNITGTIFSNCYVSDGIFWVVIFNQETELTRVNISKLLNICDETQPMLGFNDPLINSCFVSDKQMLINCYHSSSRTHYHLIYNYKDMMIEGLPVSKNLGNSNMNFPYKSFYDKKQNQAYVLYRHGQVFTIDIQNPCIYEFQQLPINDLGQMYLVYDQAIVARSSNLVLFFKQVEVVENDEKKMRWKQYYSLSHRGFIYHTEGNIRIQITTDNLIYFYIIDTETLLPTLENSMYNFMDCSQMMFGPKRKYCITYKTGQIGFNVYRKQYLHKFIAKISKNSLGGQFGVPVDSEDQIMICNGREIQVFSQKTFNILNTIKVPFCCTFLKQHEKKYKLEILKMFNCPSDKHIVVVLAGTKFFQNDTISFFLFIYHFSEENQTMELKTARDIPKELRTCTKFIEFKKGSQKEILFTNTDGIFLFNYITEEYKTIHLFEECFQGQPKFIAFNFDQSIVILATDQDVYYVNLDDDHSVDLDCAYQISEIRSVIYAKERNKFYILANKCERLLGYYLIEVDEFEPDLQNPNVLVNWRSKLDIGDAQLHLIHDEKTQVQQLVVCYKCIFINTYNTILIDLSSRRITVWYEKYHLWESSIAGVYLEKRKEFLMISQQGLGLIGLGNNQERMIQCGDENAKIDVILYPLQYCNDLILEKSNYLSFQDSSKYRIINNDGSVVHVPSAKDELVIKVEQQYENKSGQTNFDKIYNIKVHSMSLRECLMLQSIISCRQQSDIVNLIAIQPTADVFFKTFLEFQKQNLISILAFDSQCIKELLVPKHEHFFNNDYPIIYQTNVKKLEYSDCISERSDLSEQKCELIENEKKSALDIALENNQIRATNCIISHISKYQNNFVFSHLFEHNLIELISKGIEVNQLLNSDIFYHKFDFQDWPSIHTDSSEQIEPYNDSMFNIRGNYEGIFKNISEENLNRLPSLVDSGTLNKKRSFLNSFSKIDLNRQEQHKKIYKIQYTLNILPSVCESTHHGSLMNACTMTDDLEIYDCLALGSYIKFKWFYAQRIHRIMFFAHILYLTVFSLYVIQIYVYHEEDMHKIKRLFLIMGICLVFPLVYDMLQMWNEGFRVYFSSIWNYLDQAYIWFGFINIYMQYKFKEGHHFAENTQDHTYLQELHRTKTMMCLITFFQLIKTFFFMRIFKQLSYMVSMMSQVFKDLGIFIFFYLILVWMTSLIMNILEVGNFENSKSENLRKITKNPTYPGKEYEHLPAYLKQAFGVIRISLGDFDFAESSELDPYQNIIFWIVWLFIVLVTCIIFLNFIIAEVSASYEKVKVRLHGLFLKERAAMIQESEDQRSLIYKNFKQNTQNFPKYLIIREVED